MSPRSLSRLGGASLRISIRTQMRNPTSANASFHFTHRAPAVTSLRRQNVVPITPIRAFHSSMPMSGIMPDVENPAPKESESSEHPTVPTDIPTSEYNKRADEYLEELVNRLEAEQEKRQDLEVEYSAGVLEVTIQSKGTYVLNKQPPNKQIWLSSPLSGPKRFDWVVTGESMNQKEGGGVGDWIYLRDGTSLTELVRRELGVELGVDDDAPR
ncbi:arabinogalactan endo-1,4-beta-galactosidase [Zopfia rhizophila CBS 207.26]|uniref:ferroxidase n=1 Tax=Zopfia rhizophila CBS 207.26 TaxID=1314779 RepID=A0A6A6EFS9_9PEZI|nr:arabinogalactan endo-1,4-beta-galactosidase [Zopfia rhizophila CBS 207.26]